MHNFYIGVNTICSPSANVPKEGGVGGRSEIWDPCSSVSSSHLSTFPSSHPYFFTSSLTPVLMAMTTRRCYLLSPLCSGTLTNITADVRCYLYCTLFLLPQKAILINSEQYLSEIRCQSNFVSSLVSRCEACKLVFQLQRTLNKHDKCTRCNNCKLLQHACVLTFHAWEQHKSLIFVFKTRNTLNFVFPFFMYCQYFRLKAAGYVSQIVIAFRGFAIMNRWSFFCADWEILLELFK